ncbi:DUF4184 family protein [Pontibacter sp. E15-1]|uniref:DUF4184 family protein n=1 Tax=Pontibacter sp. E15-1 TaxID=2919918 RepID=UPI001F4F9960|nr:DUF4184 family protein [Pontibacter sp. E15-1]MCJ8165602.1 DUF4184 family protein [Pontibacter sp. E15-1]
MPFTFSHPALILPVHTVFKRWTSLTGLVVGSVAPDFEKFISMSADDPYSHTWRSIFYFNLPIGLLLAFVFHILVRDALINNLPGYLHRRLSRFRDFDWVAYFKQHYPVVILSILLGAASHIFWDSFTHKEGRAVGWLPFLLNGTRIRGEEYYFYGVLQMLSSLVGAVVVLFAILKLPPAPSLPPERSILPYWLTVTGIAVTVVALKVWLGDPDHRDLIFIYIAAILVGLIAAPPLAKRRTHEQ